MIRIRATRQTPETGELEREEIPGGRGCELVLPYDVVLFKRVEVAAAQRRKAAGALRYLVEDAVIPDPEQLHVVEAGASLGVVDRAWLRAVLARLAARGLKPERAVPEILLAPLEPRTWTVVCDAQGGFARTGPAEGFALDRPADGSAPVALQLALKSGSEPNFQEAIDSLRPSGKLGSDPDFIALYGSSGSDPELAERWSRELGVPVHARGAWRWWEGSSENAPDFLQKEFAVNPELGMRSFKRPMALAAAILVVASAGLAIDWAMKARERSALVAEIDALYRGTFGAQAVVVDAPLQMQHALAALKARSGEAGPSDFLPLLGALGAQVDPATERLESLSYRAGTLEAQVRAVHSGSVRRLRLGAEDGKWASAK